MVLQVLICLTNSVLVIVTLIFERINQNKSSEMLSTFGIMRCSSTAFSTVDRTEYGPKRYPPLFQKHVSALYRV